MGQDTDVAIIGGGIVGLATAYELAGRWPERRIAVLEKETGVGRHQTGHNSGVLHSGIYYAPGSLKAVNCRAGKAAMEAFCAAEGIPFERCGKVIVATREDELPRLDRLLERGQANGVECVPIGPERLREIEPHAAGLRALHVPETGIVDYGRVCERLAQRVREAGGHVRTGVRVDGLVSDAEGVTLLANGAPVARSRHVINCAGLFSDRVAALDGARIPARIVPFRGEYFALRPAARHLVRALIYPVPDPGFPFLGVHFTRTIDGAVECGPNAVLAFAREGYRKRDVSPRDLVEAVTYPGFLRLAARFWPMGLAEMWRSVSKRAFVASLRRLVPEITAEMLGPAPAGVRAQAVSADGRMVDDFLIHETERVVHVLNAPSPAATAALNIGRLVVERLAGRL